MPDPTSPAALVPTIDPSVLELRPDFRCISLNVSQFDWDGMDGTRINRFVETAEAQASEADEQRNAHLEDWRAAFRAFGAKPKRTPCSAEALLKRTVRDETLPRINPLVDAYNAVSIAHGVPIGGEDRALYSGAPHLTRALGDEPFDVMQDGVPHVEHPNKGEVIWRDDLGVTCRRWNWRQGVRTRIMPGASDLWFLLEALEGLPDARLSEAAEQLGELIVALSPTAKIEAVETTS